jgi:phage terminase large subunit-like protein
MAFDVNNEAFKAALEKLPVETRERILRDPEHALEALELEQRLRNQKWPTKNAVPNIAQERALQCYFAPHPTYEGRYPFINIFRGGNGVGKTHIMIFLIAGTCLGPYFLNKEYFNHQYFRECDELRKRRKFKLRIVCDKTDMQENGSVYTLLKQLIPMAEFKGRTSGGYYTEIRIPTPSPEYFGDATIIDVKTFDMDTEAHAGSEYDLILFNEPPPQDLYNENIGRLRRGGCAALFLTPLNQAAFLKKIENGDYPEGEVVVTKGAIWENCADIPGTRGVLSKVSIERMKRQWQENNPLEVPAREFGEYISLSGAIFPIFSDHAHVIPPMTIQPNWNIYKIIDPHDKKPPFCVWIAVTPMNQCYVIAEYPVEHWDLIKTTYLTIGNFVLEFERIQGGKHENFSYIQERMPILECLGDPNKFSDRQPGTGKTMKEEYEWAGNEPIFTKINDRIDFGHDRVRKLVLYDPERKLDDRNHPQLRIFSSCKNTIRAFKNYEWAEKQGMSEGLSDKIDKKWECPMACIRYFAVHFDGYQSMNLGGPYGFGDNGVDYDDSSLYINGNARKGRMI